VTSLDSIELTVARTLAEAEDASETYDSVLAAIGMGLGWQLGAVWEATPDGRALRCVAVWQAPEANAEEFIELTRTLALSRGEGLPGRVWASGAPAWVTDVPTDPNFPRASAGARAGLGAAFAFPIRAPTHVCGVMEFFADKFHEPDERLLASMAVLGNLIGQYVVRRRAELKSRERDALTRAILSSALDAIIVMDADGRVLEFNPGAEAMFGYRSDDVIDHDMADLIVPSRLREPHRAGLARYLRTGEGSSYLDNRIEITGLRANGEVFPVELTITQLDRPGAPVFAGFIRDITERRQAEEELRASRARLVGSADAERQRLERNLHDGAQQHLVALLLKLRLAASALEKDSPRAQQLLNESHDDLQAALDELRELARGIHPALLTDRGLGAALVALAHRLPLEVSIAATPGRLPESVEVAAYYVVAEGLTNVVKYAGVDEATVTVTAEPTLAVVEVVDEGAGGAGTNAGTGLRGLADRVEALGGRLEVDSPPGQGTRLRAEIPIVA
jgi:PAS domain S-box-containing protein